MKKNILLTTLVAAAGFGALFGYKFYVIQKTIAAMSAMKPAPVAVSTADARPATWQATLSAVGDVQRYQGITVRSELDGRITRIAFESGASVDAGNVLVALDTTNETAQLKSLAATARLAQLSLERARELRVTNTNTAADLDAAEATAAQTAAAVDDLRATIAKKRIVAPFAGRLGIRQVNLGQFLGKGDAVVTLEAVDPAYVNFAVPQQEIARIQPGLVANVTVDSFPGREFRGTIEAVNPRVSADTRNIRLRALVPNPDRTLRPGLFGRVELLLPEKTNVLVVPATAIVYSSYGDSVYIVSEQPAIDSRPAQLVVKQQFVSVGSARGDQVAILQGLKSGDRVVTAGQIKLRNGSAVQINNTVTPSSDAAPQPSES